MSDALTLEFTFTPDPDAAARIIDGLNAHNDQFAPAIDDQAFGLFLWDDAGTVRGGLLGKVGRGWLHVRILWVDPAWGKRGHGTALMARAEQFARERGCHSAYLNTFSFQARPFYEKCGYEVFGVLDDFPAGHQRIFMRKRLGVGR
jgi:GNAT superfamily N-acetyltransferase